MYWMKGERLTGVNMARANFAPNKTGFTKMPRSLTTKPSKVQTKTLQFGNSTGGKVGRSNAGFGRVKGR